MKFEIDYSDRTTASAKTLVAAIAAAQAYIANVPDVRPVFDASDKQVALVTEHVVQTVDTDPGH